MVVRGERPPNVLVSPFANLRRDEFEVLLEVLEQDGREDSHQHDVADDVEHDEVSGCYRAPAVLLGTQGTRVQVHYRVPVLADDDHEDGD